MRWFTVVSGVIVSGCLLAPPEALRPAAVPPGTPGVDASFVPDHDVKVAVGQLTQALLDSKPVGTRFALEAGTHRLAVPLRPRRNQQILGYPGAVISGSKVLGNWVKEGDRWVADGQTQRLPAASAGSLPICNADDPMCGFAEDVFFDDQPLKQVESLAKVGAGTFYFDYANSRIYIGQDPAGHRVETTVGTQAFQGGGSGVVLRNLVVEKFGNKAQTGAISNDGASGWTVMQNDVRLNHGVGIFVGHGAKIVGNKIHRQGQLGIAGNGADILVEGNEIAYNNVNGYDSGWEAGGSKWVATTNLTVRQNWAHHNAGPGLWTDIDNRRTVYEDNLVEDNQRHGIIHEISYDAKIRSNTVRRNGKGPLTWEVDGAGIVISNSQGVEAYDNQLEDNAAGIVILHSPRGNWDTANNDVHHNTIHMARGWTGLVRTDNGNQDPALYTGKQNRFRRNTYRVPNASGRYWDWLNSRRTWREWNAYGNDDPEADP